MLETVGRHININLCLCVVLVLVCRSVIVCLWKREIVLCVCLPALPKYHFLAHEGSKTQFGGGLTALVVVRAPLEYPRLLTSLCVK